jgi:hypothetical protein
MRRLVLASALLLSAVVVERAEAQSEPCGWIVEFCGGSPYGHTNQGPAPSGWINLHGECLVCLINFVPTFPLVCHPPCAGDELGVNGAVYAAAVKGDVAVLVRLAPLAPAMVSIDPFSNRVIVKSSCSEGTLIAALHLGSEPSSVVDRRNEGLARVRPLNAGRVLRGSVFDILGVFPVA